MRRFIYGAILQFKVQSTTPLVIVMTFLSPIIYGVVVASLSRGLNIAILLGAGVAGLIGAVPPQTVSIIMQERSWRTLESAALGEKPFGPALAGRVCAMVGLTVVTMPFAWLVLLALYGPVHVRAPLVVALSMCICIIGAVSLSWLMIGFIARRRYRAGMPNAVAPALLLLAGIFAPTSSLPIGLQWMGDVFPASWAMRGVYLMDAGRSGTQALAVGGTVALLWFASSYFYMATSECKLRDRPDCYYS